MVTNHDKPDPDIKLDYLDAWSLCNIAIADLDRIRETLKQLERLGFLLPGNTDLKLLDVRSYFCDAKSAFDFELRGDNENIRLEGR